MNVFGLARDIYEHIQETMATHQTLLNAHSPAASSSSLVSLALLLADGAWPQNKTVWKFSMFDTSRLSPCQPTSVARAQNVNTNNYVIHGYIRQSRAPKNVVPKGLACNVLIIQVSGCVLIARS